eukprot:163551-Rhodomonas_salina.1
MGGQGGFAPQPEYRFVSHEVTASLPWLDFAPGPSSIRLAQFRASAARALNFERHKREIGALWTWDLGMEELYERWTSEFRWIPGVTPMSDFTHLILAEIAYFAIIFGLKAIVPTPGPATSKETVKKQKSLGDFVLQIALCGHNAILCILSAAMFLGAGYEAYKRCTRRAEGYRWMFCEEVTRKAEGGIYFWTYIYYLSKFQEFIDTFFK